MMIQLAASDQQRLPNAGGPRADKRQVEKKVVLSHRNQRNSPGNAFRSEQ